MKRRVAIWKFLGSTPIYIILGYFGFSPFSPAGQWIGDPFSLNTWLTWHIWMIIGAVVAWSEIHDRLSKSWGLKYNDGKWVIETISPLPSEWNAKLEVQKYLEKKDG